MPETATTTMEIRIDLDVEPGAISSALSWAEYKYNHDRNLQSIVVSKFQGGSMMEVTYLGGATDLFGTNEETGWMWDELDSNI